MNANPICMDLEHDLSCPLDQYHLQEWRYLEENRTLQDCFLFSNFKEYNHCLGKKLQHQQDFQCSLIFASYFRGMFPIENLYVFSQSLEGSPLVAVGANLNIHKLIKIPHILQRPARFSFLENSREFFFIFTSCSRSRAVSISLSLLEKE